MALVSAHFANSGVSPLSQHIFFISFSPSSILNTFLFPRQGCSCGLGLIYTSKPCTMPPITFQDLPLNIYMVIFGTGIFVFVLSLIFCCYFIR